MQAGDGERAYDALTAGLEQATGNERLTLLLLRARLLTVLGEADDAVADLDAALEIASGEQRGIALLSRAEALEAAQRYDDARRDIDAALSLLDDALDRAAARQLLGRIERDTGDLGAGVEILRATREEMLALGAPPDRLAEATLDLAMALRLAGAFAGAVSLLEGLAQDDDPLVAARVLVQIGTTWGFAGNLEAALDAWGRALSLLPDSADRAVVRYNRAVALRDHGRLDEAMGEVERALVENAGESGRVEHDALLLAGTIAREQADFQRSLDFLREAAEVFPQGDPHGKARLEIGATLAATGLFGPAIDELSAAITLCRDAADVARAYRYRGNARHEMGLLPQALEDFDAAVALTEDPDERARGLATLATLLASAGRRTDALAALDEALSAALDETLSRQLFVQRGAMRSEFGLLDEAARDFELAIERAEAAGDHDLLSRVLADLGAIHLARDEAEQAIASLGRAVEVAVDSSVARLAWMRLGQARVSRDEPDEALEAFERAASAAEDDRDARASAFLARGNALLRWGRYVEADIEFKRILTLQPSASLLDQSSVGRRSTEHHLRNLRQAMDELTRTIEAMAHGSYRAAPTLQRGMLALAAGDFEAALVDITRATRLFQLRQEQAAAFARLALAHAAAGNCDEAAEALERARALGPEEPWLEELRGEPGWLRCRGLGMRAGG